MTLARFVLVALVLAPLVGPAPAAAQAFLASRAHGGLAVTPLFIVATLESDAADVPVEVLFSLIVPADRSALDFEQDLYLLTGCLTTGFIGLEGGATALRFVTDDDDLSSA